MPKKISLEKGDRILISRTDRIGDLILTIPLIESVKTNYPECLVDVLASDYAAPVLENNDCINEVIKINNTTLKNHEDARQQLCDTLQENNYKVALVIYPDKIISKIIFKSKIPIRVGTARRFKSIYFTRFLFHSRKANKKHESEYNLDYLKIFNKSKVSNAPHIYLTNEEISAAKKLLAETNLSNRFIVLHPGSGGSADCWPLGYFIKLCYILKERNYNVVLTGSSEEKKEIEKFANKRAVPLINLAGKTDIRTLAGLLSLADVVIANSTGPLHLAAAAGTRVIGLYPNTQSMSPVRWGPLGKGHLVIQPPNEKDKMSAMKPEDIAKTVSSMMSNSEVSK